MNGRGGDFAPGKGPEGGSPLVGMCADVCRPTSLFPGTGEISGPYFL